MGKGNSRKKAWRPDSEQPNSPLVGKSWDLMSSHGISWDSYRTLIGGWWWFFSSLLHMWTVSGGQGFWEGCCRVCELIS